MTSGGGGGGGGVAAAGGLPGFMSPRLSSPAHPTQGGGHRGGGEAADLLLLSHHEWYSPDIEVLIGDSCVEPGLCGQLGVVRGVNSGLCSVYLHDEGR